MGLGNYLWKTGAAWFLSGAAPRGGEEGTAGIGKFQSTWPLDYDQAAGDWFLGRVVPRDSITSFGHQRMIAHKASAKQHLWIQAPTRYGKGIFEILPNMLMHPGSSVLIDPKGEGYGIAGPALKAKGYTVVLLDPTRRCAHRQGVAATGDECEWNPLFDINPYDVQAPRQLAELAEILIESPPGAQQHAGAQYWTDQARIVVAGLLGYSMMHRSKNAVGILNRAANDARTRLGREDIRARDMRLTSSDRRNILNAHNIVAFCANFSIMSPENRALLIQEMVDFKSRLIEAGEPVPAIARTIEAAGRQAATLLGKNSYAEGIVTLLSMFAKSFKWIDSNRLIQDLTGLDFKFKMSDLRTKEKVAVFVVLPESALNSHGAWLRMIITSAVNVISEVDWAPGINEPVNGIRVPTNLILDEAPQYGAIPVLERAFSMSAGQDLRIVLISQNKTQIDKLYTKEGSAAIVANTSQFIVGLADVESGDYWSKKLGKTYSRDQKTGEKGDDKVALLGVDELAKRTHHARETAFYLEGGRDPIEVRLCAYHNEDDTGLRANVDYTQHREHRSAADYVPARGALPSIAAKPVGYITDQGPKKSRVIKTVRAGTMLPAPNEPKRLGHG